MTNLNKLIEEGFLTTTVIDNKEIIHLKSPCVVKVNKNVVKSLKEKYIPTEELGGILIAKPKVIGDEKVIEIVDVVYVRNAIEDKPQDDNSNKSNAYLPDSKQLYDELNKLWNNSYLPIDFHTHPTGGEEYFHSVIKQNFQTDTSKQDRKESEFPLKIGDEKLLMPRALIVGNDISTDIFIGFYNGFISPIGFEESKKQIASENIEKVVDNISAVTLTDMQKIGLGIGALILLFTIIKYPKYSLPVIGALGIVASSQLTNTQFIENPEYFNKLSFGDAIIYIP